MPQSLSQIYLHIVFSTKNRYPFILPAIEVELFSYIGGTIKNLKGFPILISGMPDHIHILTTFPRTMTVADFIKGIKAGSSRWIKTKGKIYQNFAWQDGYGVFSVSSSKKDAVMRYIAHQKQHHQKQAFHEELVIFLKKYEIAFNEQYLWD